MWWTLQPLKTFLAKKTCFNRYFCRTRDRVGLETSWHKKTKYNFQGLSQSNLTVQNKGFRVNNIFLE